MSVMVGVGRGAIAGVLVRDAAALEALARATALAIDKTGTLTEGRPRFASVLAMPGADERDVLGSRGSPRTRERAPHCAGHRPRGRARRAGAPARRGLSSRPRQGHRRHRRGANAWPWATKRFSPISAPPPGLSPREPRGFARRARPWSSWRWTARSQASWESPIPIKSSAVEAVDALRAEGVRIVMLTGDSRPAAEAVARALGIDDVRAEILPARKADAVRRLQVEGFTVAVAGDGINDAPALAAADVGLAMGTGTDVAIATAGITLVKGDLMALVRARRLARAVVKNIRQNLFWAFRLQRHRNSHRRRGPLSRLRSRALAHDRRRRHEPELGDRHRQRLTSAEGDALTLSPRNPRTARVLLAGLALVVSTLVFGVGIVTSFFLLVALNGFSEAQALPVLVVYTLVVGAGAFGASFGVTVLVARLFPREARLGLRQCLVCSLGSAALLTALSTSGARRRSDPPLSGSLAGEPEEVSRIIDPSRAVTYPEPTPDLRPRKNCASHDRAEDCDEYRPRIPRSNG